MDESLEHLRSHDLKRQLELERIREYYLGQLAKINEELDAISGRYDLAAEVERGVINQHVWMIAEAYQKFIRDYDEWERDRDAIEREYFTDEQID